MKVYTACQGTRCFKSSCGVDLHQYLSWQLGESNTLSSSFHVPLECLISLSSVTEARGLQISMFLRVLHLKTSWWEFPASSTRASHERALTPPRSHCRSCAPLRSYLLAGEVEDFASPRTKGSPGVSFMGFHVWDGGFYYLDEILGKSWC